MSTLTISLPENQRRQLDKFVAEYGFANRSEFFRSLLRFIATKPHLLERTATHPFVSPKTTSSSQILQAFKKTGKYSPEFLADLQEGLENSSHFT